jgi:hypothetical protein
MAIAWETLKTQYLQSSRSAQLDSLVLNLTRIQALVESDEDGQIAQHLVRESQFFIEWLVPTIDLSSDIELAEKLVALQRQLSEWKLDWSELWGNGESRAAIANVSQAWCEQLQVGV